MKRIAVLSVLICMVWTVSAQQSIKSQHVSPFHDITLSGRLNVEMIAADSSAIEVMLVDADISRFKWSVSDDVMNVSLRSQIGNKGYADVKIYYSEPISDIRVFEGQLIMKDTLNSGILKVSVASGATVTALLNVQDLEIEAVGNSVVQCSGNAKYMSLRATEKSKIDTRSVQSTSIEVDTSIGAEVYVSASERLVTNAKTNSSIFYKGEPQIFKQRSPKMGMGIGASVLNIGK